jgi:hypothetical protein
MLYVYGFATIGVALADLHFVNPRPRQGQEGAEQGARLELRMLGLANAPGSIYAARPITVGAPIWRVDLLETVANPGSLDRAHYHPRFLGWDPVLRHYVEEMTADPLSWLGSRLSDLNSVLEEAGIAHHEVDSSDGAHLRETLPEIMSATCRLLDLARRPWRVEAGDGGVRAGWL